MSLVCSGVRLVPARLWKTRITRNFAGCPDNMAEQGVLLGPSSKVAGASFLRHSKTQNRGCYLERRVIPIIAVVIMIAPSLAYGSPACMTQSEARAKFPKATHLYMHGSDHCWNDSAVSPEHSPRHSAHAAVLAPSAPPTLAAAPVPSPRPEIINTGIDAGAQCQYSPCE